MSKLSKVEDLNIIKIKTCVLKVNIHCEGCKKKVKKLLQKIDGVYSIAIDTEQGKVTVTGNVDSSTLIKKLRKSGKYAELWASKKISNIDPHYHLPKLPIDTAKGQKNSANYTEIKDKKMQQLQKELMNMKVPFTKDQKSVKFSAPSQDFDDGSEFDDSFDDEDDYFDETDASDDETDDYNKSATKGTVTAKKGFAVEVHSKGNGGSKNGSGGTHEAKNGSNRGISNGDGHKQGSGGKNSNGLAGIPMATGAVPPKYLNSGMVATTPAAGSSVNPYQQQYVTEMMGQQRMMMNGYPMAYGYPMPASNTYTSYFSDEDTSGSCRIM